MDFGVHFVPLNWNLWGRVAPEVDRLGYESLWVAEHVVLPIGASGSPHAGQDHPPVPPDLPLFEPMGILSWLAGLTERVRLGTHVYNIGLRHPLISARAAATVDLVSGGRLAFGVGASWLGAEWEALGLDFATRGKRVDEAIEVVRRLWTEETVEHHGRFFDFGPVHFEPKPVQPGGPPLHIGGDGPAALRRVATVGTGWVPTNTTLETLPEARERLRVQCEKYGRTTPVEITMARPHATLDEARRYRDAGVTRLIVAPWRRSREAADALARFADEVMAPVRAEGRVHA
jgi:probable F420-dependent oxidoreductase